MSTCDLLDYKLVALGLAAHSLTGCNQTSYNLSAGNLATYNMAGCKETASVIYDHYPHS